MGLDRYAEAFAAHEIDFEALQYLTDDDLKTLGLPLGPRRKVLAAIGELIAQGKRAQPAEKALSDEAPGSERRQVVVLFADLVGYTSLSSRLDPEELRALLQSFLATVGRIVAEYGGWVERHIGDCVMAVFGAPTAHGNDDERAIRAALSVRDAMAGLGAEIRHDINVHIGLACGQVVAGGSGIDGHRDYVVTGPSVNLASRLADAAAAGEIFVSDRLWQMQCDRLEGGDAGMLQIDGFAESVRAWRLAGFGERPHSRPLVGRQLELEQLRAVLASCRDSGNGRAVYIRGEAGIGKTRLLEEFLVTARQQGFICHTGLVLDFGMGIGRGPIRALARDILGLSPNSNLGMLQTAVEAAINAGLVAREDAVFLNDFLDLPQPKELRAIYDAMDNNTRNASKLRTMARLVEQASRGQPRVLAVEDLHWATQLTLTHLAELAATAARCPTVLVMTSRSEQDPIDQAWRARAGPSPLISIDLGPLRAEEAATLAAPFFAANAEEARYCIERAAGNPLFLDQLLRNAAEGADSTVPDSIQSLVQARLDRLDAADKTALQAASVLGQRFDRDALAYLLGQPDSSPERLLTHLMIRPQGEEFLFAHALIHDAVYEGLLKSRRLELHRRAAEFFAGRDAVLKAEHLDRAGDAQAPHAYLDAAKSQAAEYRYEVARQLVERGLALATDQGDRFALASFRGVIHHDLGDMPEALSAFQEALAAAGNDAERCHAWIGCAQVKRVTDDLDGAFADLKLAEDVAVAHGLKVEEARLRFLRGNLFFPQGNIDGCLREHGRSLEVAREAGSPEQEAAALGGLGDAEWVRGRMISAHRRLSECVRLARRHGYGRMEVANNAQVAASMLYFQPTGEALEHALAAAAGAERVGHMRAELNARAAACSAFFARGMLDECKAEVERARGLVRRLGAWRFEQRMLQITGRVLYAEQRREEALDALHRAYETAKRTGIGFNGPSTLGALALATDGPDARRAALDEGELLISQGCVGHNQLWFYPDAIEAALQLGDFDAAERYASALEDYTRAEPLPWSDFFADRGRALVAICRDGNNPAHQATLQDLLKRGEQLGYAIALPALRDALRASTSSKWT
jgi:class 3 adenylate cyclase/tetratricopeptide (TPR) repeat protein